MAADKFLKHNGSGGLQEVVGATTGGGTDANKIPALSATGQLALAMMPTGIGPDTVVINASEDLAAGDMVNIWSDAGTAKARKAIATGLSTACDGYVLAAVTSGNPATIYMDGAATATGWTKTPGVQQYLSETTAGALTETAPDGTGEIVQKIGKATGATVVDFEPEAAILLA